MAGALRAYAAAFDARLRVTLQYRAAALAGVSTQFWWGGLKIMILAAFFARAARSPMSLDASISYVWLGQAFLVLLPWQPDPDIVELVRTGEASSERLKPIDTYAYWYARGLAWMAARLIPRVLPLAFAAAFVLPLIGLGRWALHPPETAGAAGGFCVSILLAAALSTAWSQVMAAILVRTQSPQAAQMLVPAFATFLSGNVVPLPLLPDALRRLLLFQPFAGLHDIPFRIYVGELSGRAAVTSVISQAVWILLVAALGRHLLERGLRNTQLNGG